MACLPCLQVPLRMMNDIRLGKRADALAVEVNANLGFFAQLNWCIYILAYCEQHRLHPRIRLTGPQYSDLPNHDWFHDFFEDKLEALAKAGSRTSALSIRHIRETRFAAQYAPSMSIEWAHRLFAMYFAVKPEIESYVTEFVAREFGGGAIGLHFRGTDKRLEADPVDWPRCFRAVAKLAADQPHLKKLFVSSDEPLFIEWLSREATGTFSVVVHPDQERSRDTQAVHTNPTGSGHRKGFEALVNCLLLSRCTALIRTASFLSGWSSIFNPLLPITLLNEPFAHVRWFPDRELIHRSDNRYR